MPPYAQDAFTAANQALQAGWLDLAMTGLSVVCEPWILALIALALFSWFERDVPSVLKAFGPLVAALAAATLGTFLVRVFAAAPRPLGGGEPSALHEVAAAVARAGLSGGQALATAVFASYAILAYGRRALPVVLVALAGGFVRVHAGAHWAYDVIGGWTLGAAIGGLAWFSAVQLRPRGHLAAMRTRRAEARQRQGSA
jgi:membrane-associated phospholipid phosphatase